MHFVGLISLVVAIGIGVWVYFGTSGVVQAPTNDSAPAQETEAPAVPADVQAYIDSKADLITVTNPAPNGTITSSLTISGEARGYWFFEADFPVILTDWDGRIIAEHYATAEDEWMTEDFVPFTAELEFESPYSAGDPDFMRRGTLILQKSNPSDLPENDNALEIPVRFSASETGTSVYEDSLDSAQAAADALSN